VARELEGNGVHLVRERALAGRVQDALERVYRLERLADVADFVEQAESGEREVLLLRQADDGALEVSLRLPALDPDAGIDGVCQIIEGVSHFVYVVERAHRRREATQLELELQAEVDKWVFLAAAMQHELSVVRSAALRSRLYERVRFEHDEASESGERYRVANDTAHRFVRRLERHYLGPARFDDLRAELRRFFHEGQEAKLRLARPA
jgi:hypothetical protein